MLCVDLAEREESPTPLPATLPQPNPIFGPQCLAESAVVIKNPILVGTIIMLVAYVRHVFCYLSTSSVTTGMHFTV